LLPAGADYDQWRSIHELALERFLRVLDAEQLEWEAHEKRRRAAAEARARGLDVNMPMPPAPESSVLACIRLTDEMSHEERADAIRQCRARRRRRPPRPVVLVDHHGRARLLPIEITEVVKWIVGEALARGIACDFDTAYQAWFVFADLLLRDADIGAIVARVHPRSVEGRSPRLTDAEVRQFNADLARQERKRVRAKQKAFGYSAA
jgi:hypothetical protein